MMCHYENYEDEVLGKIDVVGAACMDCKEHGAYTKCPRFLKVQNGKWEH
jgi:hypothetical protein